MRLLHTADWHLGKRLNHVSRLGEQREVLDEICKIADSYEIDAVLIAGDIFDSANPSIEAIELFYATAKRLSKEGTRAVIGIAGNHDSPDRIEAPVPLARECGIILAGYPQSVIPTFRLESNLEVIRSAPGALELKLPFNKEKLRLILTPYANEARLREYIGNDEAEEELRERLQVKWARLAEEYFDNGGINILMAHLYVVDKQGPREEESEDEKPILTLGGAQEIFTDNLPQGTQYVAMGHLHRSHHVSKVPFPVAYSGSPLAYSMSEAGQAKYVHIVDAEPGQSVEVEKVKLEKGKPLLRQNCNSIEEAETFLRENQNSWIELHLFLDHFLTSVQRKQLYDLHDGIIALVPDIKQLPNLEMQGEKIDLSKNIEALFIDYFKQKHTHDPSGAIMDMLREVLAEEQED